MNERSREQMLDLLAKQALEGLDHDEERELMRLTGGRPTDESFELAAAMFALNEIDVEEMPANLRSRVSAAAERHFAEASVGDAVLEPAEAGPRSAMTPFLGWLGWAAAFGSILLLVTSIVLRPESPTVTGIQEPTPPPVESIDDRLKSFIESSLVNARASWAAGNVEGMAVTGDVVWSDQKQAGYMTFNGLPVNDPSKETYQLWIFDETQDPKTPIDGGTFNVDSQGRVVVPIDAKLKARNPAMFAVTIEKPGGVVVSDRKRIAALAKVSS